MDKYKNGKIYTIRYKNDDTLIYVGSTVVPLYKRLSNHKTDSKNPKYEIRQLYKKMNETDMKDWYIELYEDFPCERKEQLNKREGQVIREIGTLNKQISGRTNKEWREENKEQIKEKKKEHYGDNKEHYNKKNNEYYKLNKEQILEKQKEYYKDNKEHHNKKNNEYRENNKEKIKEHASVIVLCDCGCSIQKQEIARHKRSNKHLDIMKKLAKTLEQTI